MPFRRYVVCCHPLLARCIDRAIGLFVDSIADYETMARVCRMGRERRYLALALLRELRNIQWHMSLRTLSTRDVDMADAGAVRAAGVGGELAEHDEVECVLSVC